MIQIENNFLGKNDEKLCRCGQKEDMKHIYYCKHLNSEEVKINYEEIFEDNTEKMRIVLRRFRKNLENSLDHGIHKIVDPLYNNCTAMEIN